MLRYQTHNKDRDTSENFGARKPATLSEINRNDEQRLGYTASARRDRRTVSRVDVSETDKRQSGRGKLYHTTPLFSPLYDIRRLNVPHKSGSCLPEASLLLSLHTPHSLMRHITVFGVFLLSRTNQRESNLACCRLFSLDIVRKSEKFNARPRSRKERDRIRTRNIQLSSGS